MGGTFLCPRCGEPGYLRLRAVSKRVYYYARHFSWEGGKQRERVCYLGPQRYVAGELFNGLEQAGALDGERFRRYLLRLVSRMSEEDLVFLRDAVERALRKIEEGRAKAAESSPGAPGEG
jgi:hypothetical protein